MNGHRLTVDLATILLDGSPALAKLVRLRDGAAPPPYLLALAHIAQEYPDPDDALAAHVKLGALRYVLDELGPEAVATIRGNHQRALARAGVGSA